MIVLGGWLFADLLLGLAMIFLVANTVGAPPPTPTPTATPDQLATAEASFAAAQADNQATREALESNLAMMEQTAIVQENQAAAQRISATQTAEALATEQAMSQSELATRDAQATEDAIIAQATISAFSTEVAASDEDQFALSSDLATISAQATSAAEDVNAQATRQAEIAEIATQQAASGADVQATLAALEASNQSSADALATAQANQTALEEQQAQLQATATAFVNAAPSGALSPNSIEEIVQVDLNGVLDGNPDAVEDAEQEIAETFQPYAEAENCHVGFVLLSGRAPDIGTGNQIAEEVFELMLSIVPEVFAETDTFGQSAYETVALPGSEPTGEVVMQVFLDSACSLLESDG